MTLLKIARTLLGTVGLTAGTVLAVAEPTPEPLPKPALTSACSSCKTAAAKCSKSACAASGACKTKNVSLDSCASKCGDKADCTSKVSKNAACPKTSPVSTTADSAKECSKEACCKEACCKEACCKEACSKEACSKKDSEAQVSLNKECAGASSCKKNQAKACEAAAKVAACSKNSCKTQPVSTNAGATGTACEKSACTKGKCTKAVSTKAACSASKCEKAASTKTACEASKCTEAVATSTKCDTAKCGPSKCTVAVSTKADCSEKACEKDACSTKACSAECGKTCEGKCESCPCKAKSECEKSKCEKDENVVNTKSYRAGQVVGVGVNSNSGVVGKVIFTGSLEAGTCEVGSFARENGECKGHTVYGINFNGMKPSIDRRTVYVANCSRCREACEGHVDHDIVATSCEATPACVTSECPFSANVADACACSVCDRDACQGGCACEERELARNSEPASTACDSCDQCRCGTCACYDAAPHTGISHVGDHSGVSHVGHIRFEHFAPNAGTVFGWSSQFMNDGPHGPHTPPAGWTPSHDAYAHDMVHFHPEQELPGRIRLMTVMPQMSPGRHPHLPPGMRLPAPHPGMAMSSFGMPVAATRPQSRHSRPEAGTVEGDWSRNVGDYTMTFSCRDGRLHGSASTANGEILNFSGTFSVSQDDQIFGLIDNIEVPELPGEFTSWLVDQPFAVRFRVDGGGLIIKDFRCADLPKTVLHDGEAHPFADNIRTYVCGRFTPTDGAH